MNDRLPPNPPLREKKVRATPKGRRVDPQALADVRALLGDAPRRRDLLIEHLHKIQDRFGCLSDRHLVALADEMKLAMTEVYEVATFYHHFDVVKDGEAAPPAITVRVCDSIACELAGRGGAARPPAEAARRRCARPSRALHRPLRAGAGGGGRTAPGRVRDGREDPGARPPPRRQASAREGHGALQPRRLRRSEEHARSARRPEPGVRGLRRLPRGRRLSPARRLSRRPARCRQADRDDGALGPARPRRRRLSDRAQVADRARRAAAEGRGDQHRRRRAGHVQGPRISRARPAPLHRGHARRRLGGAGRRLLRVPARRVPRLPRDPRARARAAQGRPAVRAAADRPPPRRRRLHLRRRVGDDRVDRGQARHAAPAPAVRRASRASSATRRSSTTWRRCSGSATSSSAVRSGSRASAATAARVCVRSRCPAA